MLKPYMDWGKTMSWLEKFKSIGLVVLLTIIPALCAYLSVNNNILDELQKSGYIGLKFNVPLFKQWVLFIGTIVPPCILTVLWQIAKNSRRVFAKQRHALIGLVREWFISYCQNLLSNPSLRIINVRIFIEKKKFGRLKSVVQYLIKRFKPEFEFKKKFLMRNVRGLYTTLNRDDLEFEVSPNQQGLVGICYKHREPVVRSDLKISTEDFHLDDYQKHLTNDIDFCLCYPIPDKDNKIFAIITFDSPEHIIIPPDKKPEWDEGVANFCQTIYETLPELFK